jgi:phage host-nuclease inhibitor protein Gam
MAKVNKKQIEATLRNKLAAQYTAKVADLKKELEALHEANKEYRARAYKAEQEKNEIQDKLEQYEDWNRRLMEFMDMSDEDRKAHIEKLKKTDELDKAIKNFNFYNKMFSLLM